MISRKLLDVLNDFGTPGGVERAMARLTSRRGPWQGQGQAGHGTPFRGIVEQTPAVWVTWFTAYFKRLGVDPGHVGITWGGVPLHLATTELTWGTRYWWLCPMCGRRCEALYYNGFVACRKCHHLGYRSQCYRAYSAWSVLDSIFSREGLTPRRWQPSDRFMADCGKELATQLKAQLSAALASLEVYPVEGVKDGR